MKMSEELEKVTLPGNKVTLRIFDEGLPIFDMLCLSGETDQILSQTVITFFTKKQPGDIPQTSRAEKVELLTVPLWKDGKDFSGLQEASMKERREVTLANLDQFGGKNGLIECSDVYPVVYSQGVYDLFIEKLNQIKN